MKNEIKFDKERVERETKFSIIWSEAEKNLPKPLLKIIDPTGKTEATEDVYYAFKQALWNYWDLKKKREKEIEKLTKQNNG